MRCARGRAGGLALVLLALLATGERESETRTASSGVLLLVWRACEEDDGQTEK